VHGPTLGKPTFGTKKKENNCGAKKAREGEPIKIQFEKHGGKKLWENEKIDVPFLVYKVNGGPRCTTWHL